MSWASEGGKGKKKMWVFVAAVATTTGRNVSILKCGLSGDSQGKSVDGWAGPAGWKGLTVCDSLQQMVVVEGVYTQTHTQHPASNFIAGRR